jgi:hypothetical protein
MCRRFFVSVVSSAQEFGRAVDDGLRRRADDPFEESLDPLAVLRALQVAMLFHAASISARTRRYAKPMVGEF